MATELAILDITGKNAGTLTLDDERWDKPTNLRLLSQVVKMYQSNLRAGTASTKKRGAVSGGGKKPWKQKHTGRARAGSNRSPIWRGGGIVFGPQPRDFSYHVPKAMRRAALFESLKGKLRDQELVIISRIEASEPKTKPFAGLAKTFGVDRVSLIVLDEYLEPVVRSLRNLADFTLRRADELNALDVLNAHKVLVTKDAFERVNRRLGGLAGGEGPGRERIPKHSKPKGTTVNRGTASARKAKPAPKKKSSTIESRRPNLKKRAR